MTEEKKIPREDPKTSLKRKIKNTETKQKNRERT